MTAIKPAQLYGHTAVGMSPSSINRCKANITEATGMAGASACSTSLLSWAFRKSSSKSAHPDPRVAIPMEQISAWVGMWDRAAASTRNLIGRMWVKAYRIQAKAKNRWLMVRGPISATIASLIDLGFKPVSPTRWVTPDGISLTNFDHEPGISHHRVLDYIQQLLELKQWTAASKHHNGSGLEGGLPSLGPASRAYSQLTKEGKLEEAAALEALVINKV